MKEKLNLAPKAIKPICIYHGNCADGFTAAWAVWKAFGGQIEMHAGVYGAPPPDVDGRDVIIVDFSYKRPVLESMLQSGDVKQAMTILILDHHKTAEEDLQSIKRPGYGSFDVRHSYDPATWRMGWESWGDWPVRAVFDMNRSGAGIAWDFFHPGKPRPAIVAYAEDRDLWRFDLDGSREFSAALFSHAYDFEAWDRIAERVQAGEGLQSFLNEGRAIERKHHKDVAELVNVCKRRMYIGGHEVWAASLPYTLTSDAGHLMATGEPFAACYWDTPKGRVFSLRSTDEGLDVADIAKAYGGGGHRNASGFQRTWAQLKADGSPMSVEAAE